MRITDNTIYRDALSNLNTSQASVAKYEEQISSGKKLNQPSDDPQAAAQDVGAYADLGTLTAYSSASDTANAGLSVVDSALSDIVNQLTSAKTSAQAAEGSTVTASQRQAAVTALQGIKQSLAADLNTSYQGVYVFSGTKATTVPFTVSGTTVSAYQGNSATSSVDIGQHVSVAVTLDGQSITQGSDPADVFSNIDNLITAIQSGDNAGISSGISSLDNAFNRAVSAQTGVGVSLNRLTSQSAHLTNMQTSLQTQISGYEDADLAQAITGLQRAQTSQQAAIGALATTEQQKTLMDYIA